LISEPLARFEQTVSDLAAAWVASGDRYFADCLVDILHSWAREDALSRFQFSSARPGSWYALESMIYSAALAYSTVSGARDIPPKSRQVIETWLVKIAQHHFSFHTEMRSCCDEHFYRRSLYMAVVGAVTGKDHLFRTGLEAISVALDDLNEQGAFSLALRRGWRAIHYQNDILLHLVLIMQVAHRQGYDLFRSQANGRGFDDAVAFLMRSLESPHAVPTLPPGQQDLTFTDDGRSFTWMEIWLSHVDSPAMAQFVRHYRPIGNASVGGFATLYFKQPENPRTALERELDDWEVSQKVEAAFGARYPLLKHWKRIQ
jgi:poly(beta-D-mannuronate) lyase